MRIYTKEYMSENIKRRQGALHDRYYMYCRGVNELGYDLTPKSAQVQLSNTLKEQRIVNLIDYLLQYMPDDEMLPEEHNKAYEALIEPLERHRMWR